MAKLKKPSQSAKKNADIIVGKAESDAPEMPSFDAPVGDEQQSLVIEEVPTTEEVTFTAVATDVKPLATRPTNGQRVDQVALSKNGRIIVQAVSRKQAESIVKGNPSIKIV